MELVTRQSQANEVLERWEKQYDRKYAELPEKKVIRDRLKELSSTPIPDEVDDIIGNGAWTRLQECDECGNQDAVVVLGEELDDESAMAFICRSCLEKAIALF